ncbi:MULTISPECIES: M23 family metallopeptidase [Rhodopseudomonas]|uniref:M23 family metallopeptidase n=1 Tax=Rhodopseudomonas sp. BAL398 TaxID=3034676 RepID=UPI001F18A68B|nr:MULTISPECIES: M23 family metallopeptidase [Rhodopseudomonas]MDF3810041.1 M23 family metallopeptidase [Rhodopseudomonas sp. BAL398]WOK20599.1 M23 family metallopeptidase [Rhodopseudomonas sp. BAL398]
MAFCVGAAAVALIAPATLRADEFRTPAVSALRVDWRAALDQLRGEIGTQPAIASRFTFTGVDPSRRSDLPPALVQLNAITSALFTGISQSAVPVLLPFDTASWLATDGATDSATLARYQQGFRPAEMFDAGPAGYDALFALEPGAGDDMPARIFAEPVEVQITGSLLTYDLDDPRADTSAPVLAFAARFPGLRRFIREGYLRYAFTRFGVAYVVSIQCLDSTPRRKRLACREAYPVAERFLKALRVVGGMPAPPLPDRATGIAERPVTPSPDFTYRPSGDIIANSGSRNQGGRPDPTAYSQIRFPLAQAPAYIHSQSSRLRRAERQRSGADEPSGPYAYPWRDNFCEGRSFGVGQCPAGRGHQGQDIRPGACLPGSEDCDPRQQAVVAVRDGMLIRSPRQQAATLQVNSATEHIRFRYMHMDPRRMDRDGVLNGRRVAEGEPIGVVSNYLDRPNGTTRHLHFDVQLFTPDGWLWVNPYVTLISAYERLIGGHGSEIGREQPTAPALAKSDAPGSAEN